MKPSNGGQFDLQRWTMKGMHFKLFREVEGRGGYIMGDFGARKWCEKSLRV